MENEQRDARDDPESVLSRRLKIVREEAGITQREVAAWMTAEGFPMVQSTITKIEKGQRPVSLNEAVALAGVLDVGLSWLLSAPELDEEGAAVRAHLRRTRTRRLRAQQERGAVQRTLARDEADLLKLDQECDELAKRERELEDQWAAMLRRFELAGEDAP